MKASRMKKPSVPQLGIKEKVGSSTESSNLPTAA